MGVRAFTAFSSAKILSLEQAKQLHARLLVSSRLSSPPAVNLLRFYAAHDDLRSACQLFDEIPHKHVLLWNALIRAHYQRSHSSLASALFRRMHRSSHAEPDGHTFACVLRACADNFDPTGAKIMHAAVLCAGFLDRDLVVGSALVRCYSKLGLADDARSVFDYLRDRDLVTWNTIISAYGYCGSKGNALELFRRMRIEGEKPDGCTVVGLLSCFWDSSSLWDGKGIHGFCFRGGYCGSQLVASAFVSMYMRCSCVLSGYKVFRSLSRPDLVTWSALITGLAHLGKFVEALNLFRELCCSGEDPDSVLIASALSACGSVAAIRPAREIHCYVIRYQVNSDLAVSSALVDAYAKCGFPELGVQLLEVIPRMNSVTFNALISGLGSHGLVHEAFSVFERMLLKGFSPDHATFSAILCACCHSGLLHEGCKFFQRMQEEFHLEARTEHYVYMVKLLAMAGQLKEAYNLIQKMPCPPDVGVWGALLWGCGLHGDLDMGKIVAQNLLEINPHKVAYRVMISNLYAAENQWEQVNNLRDQMMSAGTTKKIPGLSWS